MTKMKSKKMTKSTFAIIIMAIAMVAMLAFGGTYAYFTATASGKSATATTGIIKLTNGTTFAATTSDVLPHENMFAAGQTVTFATAGSTRAQVVFISFTLSAFKADGETPLTLPEGTSIKFSTTTDASAYTVVKAAEDLDKDTNSVEIVYAMYVAAEGGASLAGVNVAFDATANNEEGKDQPEIMGAQIKLTVSAKSVQAIVEDGEDVVTIASQDDVADHLAALKTAAGIA